MKTWSSSLFVNPSKKPIKIWDGQTSDAALTACLRLDVTLYMSAFREDVLERQLLELSRKMKGLEDRVNFLESRPEATSDDESGSSGNRPWQTPFIVIDITNFCETATLFFLPTYRGHVKVSHHNLVSAFRPITERSSFVVMIWKVNVTQQVLRGITMRP